MKLTPQLNALTVLDTNYLPRMRWTITKLRQKEDQYNPKMVSNEIMMEKSMIRPAASCKPDITEPEEIFNIITTAASTFSYPCLHL